jgi:hypothetical protein
VLRSMVVAYKLRSRIVVRRKRTGARGQSTLRRKASAQTKSAYKKTCRKAGRGKANSRINRLELLKRQSLRTGRVCKHTSFERSSKPSKRKARSKSFDDLVRRQGVCCLAEDLLKRSKEGFETDWTDEIELEESLYFGKFAGVYSGTMCGIPAVFKYGFLCDSGRYRDKLANEVKMYTRLEPLQGTVIPRMLAHGTLKRSWGTSYAFCTERIGSGKSLTSTAVVTEQVGSEAKKKLAQMHEMGVLHNSIGRRNMVEGESISGHRGVFFIDLERAGASCFNSGWAHDYEQKELAQELE